jgi:hypothetical protein
MALGLTQPLVKMSTRKIPGGKGGRGVRLTTSPPSRAECHEIWEPKPPGTLWATPDLFRDSYIWHESRPRYRPSRKPSQKRKVRKPFRSIIITVQKKFSSEPKGLYVNPYQLQKINSCIPLGDKMNVMKVIASDNTGQYPARHP